MTIENDFLPFATAGGANVLPQSQYAALSALSTGYQAGIAQSIQINKAWRQSSIMSTVLAQFVCDLTGQNAIDDGTTATLLANLKSAVALQAPGRLRNVQVFTSSGTYPLPQQPRLVRWRTDQRAASAYVIHRIRHGMRRPHEDAEPCVRANALLGKSQLDARVSRTDGR